jgi:hypothetical protein
VLGWGEGRVQYITVAKIKEILKPQIKAINENTD